MLDSLYNSKALYDRVSEIKTKVMRTAHSSHRDQTVLRAQRAGPHAGKRGRPCDWFLFYFWLFERMAWVTVGIFWTNHRAKKFFKKQKTMLELIVNFNLWCRVFDIVFFLPFFSRAHNAFQIYWLRKPFSHKFEDES